jgi:PhzF family phenazine biosynthesis protein
MVKLSYTVLNAFTSSPATGNPAAVIVLPAPESPIDPADPFNSYPPTSALQAVATQLNYPMTAFLLPKPEKGSYLLRWLDPGAEVQLCGHATIALSHYLFSQKDEPTKLDLATVHHGQVVSERLPNPLDQDDVRVALDFPELMGFRDLKQDSEEWEEVIRGLSQVTQRNDLPIRQLRRNEHYWIIELKAGFDMSARGLPLDMAKLVSFTLIGRTDERAILKDQASYSPSLPRLPARRMVRIFTLESYTLMQPRRMKMEL